ncbi:OmpA family outer membrane protein [Neptunitalea chrysea]|uniref:OmpA family outer membrane protein n=2 Tax=Neptunitalea chrysea TaxID=1647581 RepID=A0A9W6EV94_9FLAO|nr:OmpA family outer membrane protein [Neptunitalea chrysea]
MANAQAYTGKGDTKIQIGAAIQDLATGINATYDIGVGQNISFGIAASYLLDVNEYVDADFGDRFDIKGRFNANLQDVLNICDCFDLYPGLNISLRNFGGHLGTRYFFTDGFGLYAEGNFPLAKYNTDHLTPAEHLNNQFVLTFGASFNF